jgi:hypothetical protein
MVEKKGEVFESEKDTDVKGIHDLGEEGPEMAKLCDCVRNLTVNASIGISDKCDTGIVDKGGIPTESDIEIPEQCAVNAALDGLTETEAREERGVSDLSDGIKGIALDERGEGDGAEIGPGGKDKGRYPEEDGESESEESEDEISVLDVKEYIRVDGPHALRNGHQIAQIGAKPLSTFDRCVAGRSCKPGETEIVARAPDGAYPTARMGTTDFKRKGQMMTGGGIVGGNDTGMHLGQQDLGQQGVIKCMRPMSGSGDFTTSSRSGMTGGSVQAPGQGYLFPQIKDSFAMPTGLQKNVLPPIDAVWDHRFSNEPSLPNFPPLPNTGIPQQIYQNDQYELSKHEKQVHEIEDYLRTVEEPVASPYSGSSGIGSPHDSLGPGVPSPGSAYSDVSDRNFKLSESEDEGLGRHTPQSQRVTLDDLDIISEVIGQMAKSEESGEKDPVCAAPPLAITQKSALISQLGQPPIYTPHNYTPQIRTPVPQTTTFVPPTTSVATSVPVIVGVVVLPNNVAPVKKVPVPRHILPKPEGATSTITAVSVMPTKKRGSRKSRNSKSKCSPTPQSGSPKTGSDSVFFRHVPSPDGSSSDTGFLPSSPGSLFQMSPGSSNGVPSPGSTGMPCTSTIQDAQLPTSVTTDPAGMRPLPSGAPVAMPQGIPRTLSQGAPMPLPQAVAMNTSQGLPVTLHQMMPTTLSQNMTRTTTSVVPSTRVAPKMEPNPACSQPFSNPNQASGGEFTKPVAVPPHQRKANKPGLKIGRSHMLHDSLSPFTQWPLRCCQSPQTCTAFAEIFLCLNSADQLKVEPTGQVAFTIRYDTRST